jgi:pimeloyl-ACP methyl ester carboxylesterase
MPRTLYFHGAGDMITHVSQVEYFRERFKNLRLEIFKNCGHAPHLSNPEGLKKIIVEEIAQLL